MASNSALFLFLTLSFLFSTVLSHPDEDECVYLIYIKTGDVARAGTHSTISLQLKTVEGDGVSVANIQEWGGIMGSNHNFFETAQLDIFTGRGPCLESTICALNLTSDGSGPYHAWYCEYLEVTVAGSGQPCGQRRFAVEEWLARDQEPFSLTAVKDYCDSAGAGAGGYGNPRHGMKFSRSSSA